MIIYLCLSLQVVKEVILPFLLCCCCFKYSSKKERLNREGMFSRLAGLGWHASSENQNDNICMSHMSSGWCCWKKDSFLSEQRPGMRSVPTGVPDGDGEGDGCSRCWLDSKQERWWTVVLLQTLVWREETKQLQPLRNSFHTEWDSVNYIQLLWKIQEQNYG